MKMINVKIRALMIDLKNSIERCENEVAHPIYDKLLEAKLRELGQYSFLSKLKKIKGDMVFWYE